MRRPRGGVLARRGGVRVERRAASAVTPPGGPPGVVGVLVSWLVTAAMSRARAAGRRAGAVAFARCMIASLTATPPVPLYVRRAHYGRLIVYAAAAHRESLARYRLGARGFAVVALGRHGGGVRRADAGEMHNGGRSLSSALGDWTRAPCAPPLHIARHAPAAWLRSVLPGSVAARGGRCAGSAGAEAGYITVADACPRAPRALLPARCVRRRGAARASRSLRGRVARRRRRRARAARRHRAARRRCVVRRGGRPTSSASGDWTRASRAPSQRAARHAPAAWLWPVAPGGAAALGGRYA